MGESVEDLQLRVTELEQELELEQLRHRETAAQNLKLRESRMENVVLTLALLAGVLAVVGAFFGTLVIDAENDRDNRQAELHVCEGIEAAKDRIECLRESNTSGYRQP